MRQRRNTRACALLALLLMARIVGGAEIELRDGTQITGKILKQRPDSVKVEMEGMTISIPKEDIRRIDGKRIKVDFAGVYEQKARDLFSSDVEGHLGLAAWCKSRGLHRQMAIEILAVLREEPRNERARVLLDKLRPNPTAEEVLALAVMAHVEGKYARISKLLRLLRKRFSRTNACQEYADRIKQMERDVHWEFMRPLAKLREFAQKERWAEGRARFDADLDAFAQGEATEDTQTLRELFLCYRACKFLPLAQNLRPTSKRPSISAWLIAHPGFAEKLFQTIAPEDKPRKVLACLNSLRAACGQRILRHGDLPIAFSVVWDTFVPKHKQCDLPQCDLASSYAYYAANPKRLIFDFRKLPCCLLKYVVDSPTSIAERQWAVHTYGIRNDIGKVFFDVPYDIWSLKGYRRKIRDVPYTLPNLVEYGGVCVDQAYFAANVAKSLGVPATVVGGVGERGGHAWVGYVQWDGKRFAWNLNTGRYVSDHYYEGRTRDPQTRKAITDHTLALDSISANLDWARVSDAQNYLELSKRMLNAGENDRAVQLLDLALKRNPYDRLVWEEAARLCQRGVVNRKKADELLQFVLKGFPEYPDFSMGIFRKLIKLVPEENVKKRNALYNAAFKVYQGRPDLAVQLRTEQGDYLAKHGRRDLGYAAYADAITRYLEHGRLVAELTRKAVKMNLEDGKPRNALNLILTLLPYCKEPPYENPFAGASVYYQLKKTLAQVYRTLGNENAALAVEAELRHFIYAR